MDDCDLVRVVYSAVCLQINFGGLPVSVKPSSGGRENFVGCMEGITYNGDNITNLVRRKKVDTSSFVRQLSLPVCVCLCVTNLHWFSLSVFVDSVFSFLFKNLKKTERRPPVEAYACFALCPVLCRGVNMYVNGYLYV